MTQFQRPDWAPRVPDGFRVLVTGATGGIGRALVAMLAQGSACVVGAHGRSNVDALAAERVIPLEAELTGAADCTALVDRFVAAAGGIDALVVLSGGICGNRHWLEVDDAEWEADIDTNLNHPFFLSRAAFRRMREQGTGGRIVLNGTESALHGGGPQSFAYGVAKRATECLVQGLAREGAADGITVNGVRLGLIESGFHQRWQGKTADQMAARAGMVPLKRGGHPDEAAALIAYLLSGWSGFITGQMLPLTGGDWL